MRDRGHDHADDSPKFGRGDGNGSSGTGAEAEAKSKDRIEDLKIEAKGVDLARDQIITTSSKFNPKEENKMG